MKYPNAAKGVSKLFTSEIISLIGIVILSVSGIIYYASKPLKDWIEKGGEGEIPSNAEGAVIACAAFASIALIIMVVAAIIKIVGVVQAAKDEDSFRVIIYVTVLAIVLSVVVSIVTGTNKSSEATGFSNTLSSVLNLLTTFLVIGGISNLSAKLGKVDMIAKGNSIVMKIFWTMIFSLIANIIVTFSHNKIADVVAVVLAIISAVLSIVAYILYLLYLARAKKVLSE